MTERRWDRTVRDQLALGRLLPLAGTAGGAWLTESAASAALRRTGEGVSGARLGKVSFTAAEGGRPAPGAGFPAPATAPPPGPLVLTATCGVHAQGSIGEVTEALRPVLAEAARGVLGLDVVAVDLRVAELLDEAPEPSPREEESSGGDAGDEVPGGDGEEAAVGRAVLAVPGVAGLARRFGPGGRAVRLGTAADGRRAARIELTASGAHALPATVAAVRGAVAGVLGADAEVAVLVTGWRG
ncbi:hypothetical protein [Streptomyces sp. NRRL F-5630]|uniref:hypothetical protein n=1 Tax=Streptomyces sp. NRRL F-5630 TaxID=1463864 RepID=UPI003D73AFAB